MRFESYIWYCRTSILPNSLSFASLHVFNKLKLFDVEEVHSFSWPSQKFMLPSSSALSFESLVHIHGTDTWNKFDVHNSLEISSSPYVRNDPVNHGIRSLKCYSMNHTSAFSFLDLLVNPLEFKPFRRRITKLELQIGCHNSGCYSRLRCNKIHLKNTKSWAQ